MIITIARECGCNADKIGEILSRIYDIPCYNKKEIIEIAKEKGVYDRNPNFFSENPINSSIYAIAEGALNDEVLEIPLKALRATIGTQDCILIGRCGNYAFREKDDVFRVFISGDKDKRINNIMKKHNISRREAEELVSRIDKKRRDFHTYYTKEIWGYAGNYDLCVNESRYGVEGTIELIKELVGGKNFDKKVYTMQQGI